MVKKYCTMILELLKGVTVTYYILQLLIQVYDTNVGLKKMEYWEQDVVRDKACLHQNS